jgi:glyoxylase-like metal-dependent hydrolase (beta-lactamase superfamily II)
MQVARLLRWVLICAGLVTLPAALAQTASPYELFQVKGDVYQFRANGHYGTFVPTSEGVVLIDPISTEAGEWLKGQLAARFPGRPVKTIIYSHHDGDHSGGAEAFADTTTEIVAQANAPRGIAADDRVDVMPTRTFSGKSTVELGGKTIELIELGPGHTDSLIGVRFPDENILLVVDIFSGQRLPFQGLVGPPDVDTIIGTLRNIESLEFDVLLTGHSRPSNIADLVGYRTFLENLRAQVLQARREGRSVEEMKQSITMPAYSGWTNYAAWMPPSVENMNLYLEKIGAK